MRTPLATLICFLAVVAPAAAQATATATPNKVGKGTKLHIELDATQPPVSGRIPTSTTLSAQAGYRFNGKAVAARCTLEQAQQDACPVKSGIGTAVVTAEYGGMTFPVPLRLYLAKPQQAGDLAAFEAVATLLGSTYAAEGRIVRTTTAPFGLQVILPTPGGLGSFPATFKAFKADVGVSRTVKVKKGRGKKRRTVRVRHNLITNPKTCTGTWASQAAFTFEDGSTATVDAPIACVS